MQATFETFAEDRPGPKWKALFDQHWPAYRAWFLARGGATRPPLSAAVRKLRRFMPELVPTYERLVELAGGDALTARLLSFYRPPAYLVGCSQAVWMRSGSPFLVRNYDLDPGLIEGVIWHTRWHGRRVITTSEFLWGAADGMNDAGLAISLTFGGRPVVGDGFGIPVIVRYILEFCDTTRDALDVLRRVPSHMAYNVTMLDRQGDFATALLSPDRPTIVRREPVATNHQVGVEWPEQARFSRTLERERFLSERLADARTTPEGLTKAFLRPPLFSTDYERGFGTLYTAVYRPERGEVDFVWPDGVWSQSFDRFQEGQRLVRYRRAKDARQLTTSRPGKRRRQCVEDVGGRTTSAAGESDATGSTGDIRRVFTALQDALYAAGHSLPTGVADEIGEELDRPGKVAWERLGAIWARHASEWRWSGTTTGRQRSASGR